MVNTNLVLKKSAEYELLDSGEGRKLERFGKYILVRPEKQAMWNISNPDLWTKADVEYIRTGDKFGDWKSINPEMPREWIFEHNSIKLKLKLTPFGHVGVFPEQTEQWDWLEKIISNNITIQQSSNLKILSLFSYTGGATLAAAAAGAHVTHVDASKPAITWAVENQKLSNLQDKPIRWIVDDALKFVKREERRGNKYDGIIMDPPKFGRGPKGEVWQFEKNFPELLESCQKILSNNPLFFLVTTYTIPISSNTLANMVSGILPEPAKIEFGELAIEETGSKRLLPTSIFSRWRVDNT